MFKNPFYLAVFPLVLGFILYGFHWGTVLQPLNSSVRYLLISFMLAMLFFGYLFKKTIIVNSKLYDETQNIKFDNISSVIIVIFMTLVEGAYFKGFPIMGTVSYADFGIPMFHPIILTFNSYVLVSVFYAFGINFSRHKNILYIAKIVILSIPYVLEVNRGMLVMTLIAGLISLLNSADVKIKLKSWIRIIFAGIVAIYLFGLSGNYRINAFTEGSDKFFNTQYLLSLGGAPTSDATHLFKPFYWGYIYLTTSFANLNSTISLLTINMNNSSFIKFIIVEFLPDFISKRFYPIALDMSSTRVNSQFTTGTVFNSSYYLYGWVGIVLTFVYILVLPFGLHLILKDGPVRYYVIGFSFLSSMYLFLSFSSMLSFTGLSMPIIFAVIGSIMNRKKERKVL